MQRFLLAVIASLFLIPAAASAAPASVPNRITQPVNDAKTVTLQNHTHPLATLQNDRGLAPADLPMARMRLVLKRSEQQQAELTQLLRDLQTPGSPVYHKWLTPEEFGRRFGPSDSDLQVITQWLQSHGLTSIQVTKGRMLIEFSGTAALVEQALHTSIHRYLANGESHWANATAPQIPAALSPVVAGIASLNNFFSQPQHIVRSNRPIPATYQAGTSPQITFGDGTTALTPGDLAVIYNSAPLAQSGVNGTGTTVAVIGRSNINVQDIADFRRVFGLPENPVQVIVNGNDPGNLGGGEEMEAILDNEYAGSLAPNATIKFIVSASTFVADGVNLSEIYAIDNNVADIMTESFSLCEWYFSAAGAEEKRLLAEQAAAQGITYMVSAGDSGSAGCSPAGNSTSNDSLVYVNMLASPPDVVSVGGTQFNENGNPSGYWGSNDPATRASALSYIPEEVWNESCTPEVCGGSFIYATGGGASIWFPKPSWQSGVPGVPEADTRYLPDISLASAGSHDFYLLCIQGSCQPDDGGMISFWGVGGTSAAAPTFASIMALVDQSTNSRQGNANHVLYRLAANQDYSQCNGSDLVNLPSSTCIFHDVSVGSNAVPGLTGYGTPDGKYPAGVGYDMATGLGSVNVANLVDGWKNLPMSSTTTSVVIAPTDTVHGTASTVNVSVSSDNGIPTGSVAVFPENGGPIGTFRLDETGAATGNVYLPGGTYQLTARYAGDGNFSASLSEPVSVSVTPEDTDFTLKSYVWNETEWRWVPSPSASFGQTAAVFVTAKGVSGNGLLPTGDVRFMFDGEEVYAGPLDPDGTLGIQFDVAPPFGDINVTAEYAGNNSYKPANTSLTFALEPALTTTLLEASRNTVHLGSDVTLSAAVTTTVDAPLYGTVTFYSGELQLGAPVELVGEKGSSTPRATATITTTQLAEGQNIITAVYTGNELLKPSTSASVMVTVTSQIPTSTALTASSSSVAQNASITFTANVRKEFTGGSALSGAVQFAVDNSPVGSPVALSNTGTAEYTTSSLAVGQHIVSATYSGNTDYLSSSGLVSVNVNPPAGFTFTAAENSITIAKGGSGSRTLNVTATNGFIGSVAFTCAVSPVKVNGPTCSLSPTSVNLDSTHDTAEARVTIATTGSVTLAALGSANGGAVWMSSVFGVFGIVLMGARRHRSRTLVLFATIILLIGMVGCGGGSTNTNPPDTGTPVGTYAVTVMATNSGLPAQTTTITVNVQ